MTKQVYPVVGFKDGHGLMALALAPMAHKSSPLLCRHLMPEHAASRDFLGACTRRGCSKAVKPLQENITCIPLRQKLPSVK